MADAITITLAAPITAHNETLTSLTLRRPTVAELRAAGAPYRVDRKGGAAVDYDACAQLIAMICAIPPSVVNQMDAADFDDISWRLVGFMRNSSDPAPTPALVSPRAAPTG